MKKTRRTILPILIVIIAIALIGLCFTASIVIVENHAKDDCFDNIEEVTDQLTNMFLHSLEQSQSQLELFADILASNTSNPEPLLQAYMENFCNTQNFAAVCVHRPDDTFFSYGHHPHDAIEASFGEEKDRVPYISQVFSAGEHRSEQYIYLATPVVRDNVIVAVLYGYISLDTLPSFVSCTAYDGKCQFYIVDGNTGHFLMDEYHRYSTDGSQELPLGNAYDGRMGGRETKPGYTLDAMRDGMRNGESGYFIFKSQRTGQWYYTYYMPLGINNWSMQITIDEPTAFATYYTVRDMVFGLMMSVLALCLLIIVVLILQTRVRFKADQRNLHKADYMNRVQSTLLMVYNDPDVVDRALRLVAQEMQAETALLLTFHNKMIQEVYFWPSEDKPQANALKGINTRDMFPLIFDALVANESIFCDRETFRNHLPEEASQMLEGFGIFNIQLVPVADNAGVLKGALAAININIKKKRKQSPEMLEYVTRDFFMAVSNLESHNIIKRMGAMDYLTGIKNRNSYETELALYETADADSLWCVFVDANGLHELNNSMGHKAGDAMLCAVADAMRKIFGDANCYRIGGDEFIAFRTNSSLEEMAACKRRLRDEMAGKGYSVSVGFEGTTRNPLNVFDVESLISQAEAIMYAKKWQHYEQNGISKDRQYLSPEQRAADLACGND